MSIGKGSENSEICMRIVCYNFQIDMTTGVTAQTVDAYIASYPEDVQEILRSLRVLIREEVPGAEEVISYGVPTFKKNGRYVVYFAAFKTHISIYPAIFPIEEALPEAAKYRTGKGTLQFPLDKPLPMPLIRKIVRLLLEENEKRAKNKK